MGIQAATLPPAARVAMKITTGMRPIPMSRVASALVVASPKYKPY